MSTLKETNLGSRRRGAEVYKGCSAVYPMCWGHRRLQPMSQQ